MDAGKGLILRRHVGVNPQDVWKTEQEEIQ